MSPTALTMGKARLSPALYCITQSLELSICIICFRAQRDLLTISVDLGGSWIKMHDVTVLDLMAWCKLSPEIEMANVAVLAGRQSTFGNDNGCQTNVTRWKANLHRSRRQKFLLTIAYEFVFESGNIWEYLLWTLSICNLYTDISSKSYSGTDFLGQVRLTANDTETVSRWISVAAVQTDKQLAVDCISTKSHHHWTSQTRVVVKEHGAWGEREKEMPVHKYSSLFNGDQNGNRKNGKVFDFIQSQNSLDSGRRMEAGSKTPSYRDV